MVDQFLRNSSLVLSFFVIINFPIYSQNNQLYSFGNEPEKIYLQLDGKVYSTDKTIWFKSIVTNASDHTLGKRSGILYVELISPTEKILEKKLIKLENGIGTGFFDLNKNYTTGTYLIRAYTEWDRNFGSDFFYKEYIQVFDLTAKVDSEPIKDISLIEKDHNKRQISAYFDPVSIDSLHKKELTVLVTRYNHTDTLSIEKNTSNRYAIDLDIPDSCQFVTLKMLTKSKFSYSKTIVIDEDHLDLQFFPESGELVHGITSLIGFKTLDYNGKGIHISGEIVNGAGMALTRFKSNQLGMGSFILYNPDKDETYFAKLKSKTDTSVTNLYPLPRVNPKGNVLSVIRKQNEFRLTASSSYLKNDSIYIKVTCRGFIFYDVKGKLDNGVLSFLLPFANLPDGIIAFTMMDNKGQPVAERLAFNENPGNRLNIDIIPDKNSYSQRELTRLDIKTSNYKFEPIKTSLSLLVLNKEQMGLIQNRRQNILSYFLLNSDLRGEIENPGYYFSENGCAYDLDALMLTQGWRRYIYDKSIDKFLFQPESKLNLSGYVGGTFLINKKKAAEITMMTFGRRKSVQTQTTDSTGKFYFNLNDEYGQNVNILIQCANRAGNKKDYSIKIDRKESPEISFNHISAVGKVDSIVKKLVEKNVERKKVDETYKLSGEILLGEVKVEAYKITPERKKVMQQYGKPDRVISGEDIQAKEEKWSFGLYSVIQAKYPDIFINRYLGYNEPGYLWAQVRKTEPTLVVIDGITVENIDYHLIPNISPSEVKSFEIIKDVKNRSKIWFEFCPYCSPLDIPPTIDVISIYTYSGSGIYGVSGTKGITKAVMPVFSTPREFYAPKYEKLQPSDWYKPDLRALIHWEPEVGTDSLGKATATFYNADITGEMEVVVEAISEDGKIGYQKLIYNVTKKDLKK